MINDLKEIINIKSVKGTAVKGSPFGEDIKKTLDWFLDKAKEYGLKAVDGEGYYGYVEIGEGERLLGIACHLDTVEASEYKFCEDKKYLYGRGVVDNKGPAIIMLHILRELKDSGLKHRIRLILGCDEESGSRCLKHYREKEEIPEFTIVPDSDFPVVNSEKGILHLKLIKAVDAQFSAKVESLQFGDSLNVVAEQAQAVVSGKKLVVSGTGGHASSPIKNSAAKKLFNKIGTSVAKQVVGLFCNKNKEFNASDKESGKLTIVLTKGEYDGGKLTLYLDIRLPLSVSKNEIIEKISTLFPCEIVEFSYKPNLYIDKNDEKIKKLLEVYSAVTKKKAKPICTGGGTYARELPNAVAFGPSFPKQKTFIHAVGERISKKKFAELYSIYFRILKTFFWKKKFSNFQKKPMGF